MNDDAFARHSEYDGLLIPNEGEHDERNDTRDAITEGQS